MAETIQIQDELLPKNLFILPIGSKPLFPGLFLPLLIIDKEDMDIVNQAIAHGGLIGALLQNDEVLKEAKEEKDYSWIINLSAFILGVILVLIFRTKKKKETYEK